MAKIAESMDGGFIYRINNACIKVNLEPSKHVLQELVETNGCDFETQAASTYKCKSYAEPTKWFGNYFIETPELYKKLVEPNIPKFDMAALKFESVLYIDDDFFLAPDIKYTRDRPYYIAYVLSEIRSLRDLNTAHIALLKRMGEISKNVIAKQEKVSIDKLRAYIHYYPSHWRFHVHFNLLQHKLESTSVDYSRNLSDVIEIISHVGNYFAIANLELVDRFAPIHITNFINNYIEKYLSSYITNVEDFLFREEIRKLDAIKYKKRPEDVANGSYTLKGILAMFMQAHISDGFKNYIGKKTKRGATNCRKCVRQILMYPTNQYPDFTNVADEVSQKIISTANDFAPNMQCSIRKINKKLCYIIGGNFDDYIWDVEAENIASIFGRYIGRQDGNMIHLIHSDVVSDCDPVKLELFLEKYQRMNYDLVFDGLKHTFSPDWSILVICLMLSFKSQAIEHFLNDFHATFGIVRKPASLHKTIGVTKRC